jgi:hypothetical protein
VVGPRHDIKAKKLIFYCSRSQPIQVLVGRYSLKPSADMFKYFQGKREDVNAKVSLYMNMSHLKNQSYLNYIRKIWNILLRSRGEDGLITWCKDALAKITSFLTGYKHRILIISREWNKAIQEKIEHTY